MTSISAVYILMWGLRRIAQVQAHQQDPRETKVQLFCKWQFRVNGPGKWLCRELQLPWFYLELTALGRQSVIWQFLAFFLVYLINRSWNISVSCLNFVSAGSEKSGNETMNWIYLHEVMCSASGWLGGMAS